MRHTLPSTLPGDWIAAVRRPSSDGVYEGYTVVRASKEKNAYDPFMVHTAHYIDEGENAGKWSYGSGDYCKSLDRALAIFVKRSGLQNTSE